MTSAGSKKYLNLNKRNDADRKLNPIRERLRTEQLDAGHALLPSAMLFDLVAQTYLQEDEELMKQVEIWLHF